jgi:hypothetical protein
MNAKKTGKGTERNAKDGAEQTNPAANETLLSQGGDQSPDQYTKRPKTNNEYFDTFDPRNGMRFDIPMLNTTDPRYYYKYIDYMKMREQSPDTFEKVLSWD